MNTLPKNTLLFVGLILLTAALFLLDIAFGSVRLPLEALLSDNPIYHEIIVNFRLPKALTAIITGASISVAGLLMQTLFRNPLAGPYVLGVSSGASLGVAIFLLGSSFSSHRFYSKWLGIGYFSHFRWRSGITFSIRYFISRAPSRVAFNCGHHVWPNSRFAGYYLAKQQQS